MITVIGLGNERGDITKRGEQAILRAANEGGKIFVRTAKTKSYQSVLDLGVEHTCLDEVYEKSRNFASLAKNLADVVRKSGDNTVYLVDGAPSEDYSVKALIRSLRGKVEIIDGVSKITSVATQANFNGCSYTALSAYDLISTPKAELPLPLIVYDLDDKGLAGDIKLMLGNLFGEETKAKWICGGKTKNLALYELDRQKFYDYTGAVAIEEIPLLQKTRFTLQDLQEIVVRLRAPDGCPWDKVQTPDSIKMSAVEEAYELVDAIDKNDDEKVLEEAGDLLLQTIFHAVMKDEVGAFGLTDVISAICTKLITRHTHVFGEDKATDGESALSVWEKNKRTEKHHATFAATVNDVPLCFPAAMRAQKVGKRAAKAGMDFASVGAAAIRLKEELVELSTAIERGETESIEKEAGDLLFAAVNVGRKAGADCEKALKESVERFAARFTLAEEMALKDGKDVTTLSEKEWDKYYIEAKKQLNGK